jgi:threonylcarbamoyladenosine tRNA methylthiotransferase MtaB
MMRRRYSIADFQRLCDDLDKKVPRICIGTDVIVGFPYEDTSSFENTYGLLQEAPVHYFHVFPFSPKRGTPAAKMLGQVPHALKKERASQLRELSRYKTKKFRKKFLGQTVEVILETESKAEYNAQLRVSEWSGVSQNYLPVTVQTARGKCGELRHCVLREEREDFLVGKDDAS